MKQRIYLAIFGSLLLLLTTGCSQLHINRGRIEDDITISITGYYPSGNMAVLPFNRPIVIKPNTFFELNSLGLNDNPPVSEAKMVDKSYRNSHLQLYEIKIESADGKVYYGRIAFFSALRKASNQAVTSYYKISFSDRFPEATDGRTAYYYERYHLKSKTYPTWVIWASDAPLK